MDAGSLPTRRMAMSREIQELARETSEAGVRLWVDLVDPARPLSQANRSMGQAARECRGSGVEGSILRSGSALASSRGHGPARRRMLVLWIGVIGERPGCLDVVKSVEVRKMIDISTDQPKTL